MKISVIILSYNNLQELNRLLESLPLYKKKVEWIVVDNGTTSPYQLIPAVNLPVKWIHLEQNQGIPGGFNAGIRASSGDWIVCLASDNVCSDPMEFPENTYRKGKVLVGPSMRSQHIQGVPGQYIEGWCFAFPRGLVKDIGYMDEYYVYCWEDVDWSIRAQLAGYNLQQIDCGIMNPDEQRMDDIPKYHDRNLDYLRRKFRLQP